MADLTSILSDPNYVNANEATKKAIFEKFSAPWVVKINNEINGDDAKLILNTIVEKFINRKIKHINKNQ